MTTHQRLIAARKEINRGIPLVFRAIGIDVLSKKECQNIPLQPTITLPEHFDGEKKNGLLIYDEMAQWEQPKLLKPYNILGIEVYRARQENPQFHVLIYNQHQH